MRNACASLCLLVGSEMTVGQINEELPDLSQSALSQHLARLRDEGMVSTRREAQTIWYRLVDGPAQTLIATLYGIYCMRPFDQVIGPGCALRAGCRASGVDRSDLILILIKSRTH